MQLPTDLRLAFRFIRRSRGLAALAILTLALGIGANTAIFSALHGALLASMPYADAERLVQVWNSYPLMDLPQASVSVPDYFDRREGVAAFEESALYHFASFNLVDDGPPERVIGIRATASLFPLVRVQAEHGRVFQAAEDEPGADRVVVLSHGLWQSRFGGDPGIVGREIRLNGEPHLVVGVMAENFAFPNPRVALWRPFAPTAEQRADESRGTEFAMMLARLSSSEAGQGASIELAQQQIDAIHARNLERFPQVAEFWKSSGFGGIAVPLREELYGDLRPLLLRLQGVVLLVLLIACANVANLLLVRLGERRRELALRSTLGASRWRLARQLLVESGVLSLLGGAAGIFVAYGGLALLRRYDADLTGADVALRLEPAVLLFTLGAALLTGLLAGILPIASLLRTELNTVLKSGDGRTSGDRGAARPRHLLVVAEVALALVVLVGAGLLIRTFLALQNEDPGFDKGGVVTARVTLPTATYSEDARIHAFFDDTLERIGALPGVKAASVVSDAPFSGSSSSGSYEVVGYEPAPGESAPHALRRVVGEDYFELMGIDLLKGRAFERGDNAESEKVVVVDRRLVEKYWPDGDVLTGRLGLGGEEYRIVGVVEPVKIASLDQPITKETIYFSRRQVPRSMMTFVVRTETPPEDLGPMLRDAVLAVDPVLPIYDLLTLKEQVAKSLRSQRVSMLLLSLFGGLALILAAIGIYGVLSFGVAQRGREIGTRMALGADASDVVRMVVRQGMVWVAAGLALGLAVSLALGRVFSALLFHVEAWDPATLSTMAAILAAVALLACWRPARRATRVDPLRVLREE